jgi:hypothetical protein
MDASEKASEESVAPSVRLDIARPAVDTDPTLIAMSRQAHRSILNRLTAEVIDAVAEGATGVPEAARLVAWMHGDLLPWARDREMAVVDEARRAALRSDRGVLMGLESLLTGASGYEAANWTRQIHRTATIMLARMEIGED